MCDRCEAEAIADLKVWLDGEWVSAEAYAKAAELVGAKTVGEVYGIPVGPSGQYKVSEPDPNVPHMWVKIKKGESK